MCFFLRFLAINLIFCFGCAQQAFSFVFLSSSEARIKPMRGKDVYFHLTEEAPSFVDKMTFDGGIFADNSDSEIFNVLVQAAMKYWNDIPNLSIQMQVNSVRDGRIDPLDGIFSIGVSEISQVASGLAYPRIDDVDPSVIKDCDIEVSSDVDSIPSFIYVMTHELGHCLGLGHNHNDPSAVMGYWTPTGVLSLGLDDIAGALYLYPASSSGRTLNFAPCGNLAGIKKEQKPSTIQAPGDFLFNLNSIERSVYFLIVFPIAFWLRERFNSSSYRRRQQKIGP